MIYKDLEILNNIVDFYKKLPGIGEKSAERMALSSIEQDEKEILKYAKSLKDSKTELKKCEICGHLTSKKICSLCSDE